MAQSKTTAPKNSTQTPPPAASAARDALAQLDAMTQQLAALRAALAPETQPAAPAADREAPFQPEAIRARLLTALRAEQAASEQTLAKMAGVTSASAHHHLHMLARKGEAVKVSLWERGHWVVRWCDAAQTLLPSPRAAGG